MKYGKMKASGGMYMKVLVIDDSASDTQEIVSLFEEFQRQNSLHIEVDTTTVLPDALEVIKHYDIVMLDIEIGTYNGIEFACELRCLSTDIRIIFVSNYSKYLLDGYKASANLYLLKPINPTQFALELQRIAWSYLYQQKASIFLNCMSIRFISRKSNILRYRIEKRSCILSRIAQSAVIIR